MPEFAAFRLAVPATVLALLLAGCAGPTAPTAEPTPAQDAPVGAGDFTPDEEWFTALDLANADLTYYVESWGNQECTMAKVAEGDFNCSIHIAGIFEGARDAGVLLVDVIDVTPEAADQVAGLEDATALAPAAADAATAYTEQGCDFSPGGACEAVGDELVSTATALQGALAGWTRP